MTPSHHPHDESLLRYAAATLDEGAALVLGVHTTFCASCRARVETFEAVGGALLEDLDPTAMAIDAFARTLQRLDRPAADPAPERVPRNLVPGFPVPAPLRDYAITPWRALAPGLQMCRVPMRPGTMNVFFLRATPGMALLEHSHRGDEYICVLKGAFVDQTGRHGPGDMAVADANVLHKPRVEMDGECICLVALDGKLRLSSILGRLLQPIFGI